MQTTSEGLVTLWVMYHDTQRKFDREDVRILSSLADFTAATLCTLRLQQQRQQAEDLYRSLIQGIPNIVFSFDRDGNTTFVNEQWTVYTGMSHEGGLGWAWRAAVHPDDLPRYQKVRGAALTNGQGYETGVPDETKGRSLPLAIDACDTPEGWPRKDHKVVWNLY